MQPLRGRGSIGCALGIPAGEECECFSGASVAIRSPVHKEGLVGVTGQMQGLVVDFQRTDDGVAEAFMAGSDSVDDRSAPRHGDRAHRASPAIMNLRAELAVVQRCYAGHEVRTQRRQLTGSSIRLRLRGGSGPRNYRGDAFLLRHPGERSLRR